MVTSSDVINPKGGKLDRGRRDVNKEMIWRVSGVLSILDGSNMCEDIDL